MKNLLLGLAAVGALVLSSCGGSKPKPAYESEVDLKEYGIPVKVKAPQGATVTNSDGLVQDVKIEGTDYYIQIYGVDATTTDRKALKAEELANVKGSTSGCSFKRFVQEEEFGFVYELACSHERDTTKKFYDFRYLLVRGEKAYTFQTTTTKPFTEEQVKNMYAAVKQEEAATK